jgi:hypothetical protein
VAVGSEGFASGELVAVCVVVTDIPTLADGTAVIELPASYVRELPTGEIVLVGRSSGTLAVRTPAAQL